MFTLGRTDSPDEPKMLDVIGQIVDTIRAAGSTEPAREAFHL